MPPHGWRARYGFACAYLACFTIADVVCVLLSPSAQDTLTAWASTSVANLEHELVIPLILSALLSGGFSWAWPALIALAVFGANRAVGSLRTLLICAAGQVVGTAVSEGIVAYRVDAGQLPAADRQLIDVGPSYVVVAAIVIAILAGGWLARALAALDFVLLVFGGDLFGGLSQLDVAAVGHVTAILTALVATTAVLVAHRRARASASRVPDGQPDEIGDGSGAGPEYELP